MKKVIIIQIIFFIARLAIPHPGNQNPMQVLIVDDVPMVGKAIAIMLKHVGRVTFFLEAKAALKDFQPGRYDIALIDLGMPDMPGHVLAERFKAIDPDLPCICITDFPLADGHPGAAIFDAVVPKPFGIELLVSSNALQEIETMLQNVRFLAFRHSIPPGCFYSAVPPCIISDKMAEGGGFEPLRIPAIPGLTWGTSERASPPALFWY